MSYWHRLSPFCFTYHTGQKISNSVSLPQLYVLLDYLCGYDGITRSYGMMHGNYLNFSKEQILNQRIDRDDFRNFFHSIWQISRYEEVKRLGQIENIFCRYRNFLHKVFFSLFFSKLFSSRDIFEMLSKFLLISSTFTILSLEYLFISKYSNSVLFYFVNILWTLQGLKNDR